MKGRIRSDLAKRVCFLGTLSLLCGGFSSCKIDVEETLRVPLFMTVEYENLSGVKVDVYNSTLRGQDNRLAALSPGYRTRERYGEQEQNRPAKASPNREGEYYLQFYFPVYGIKVPLVLPAGRGDMVDAPNTGGSYETPVRVTIPPLHSWFTREEPLAAVTNAYIIIKNDYGSPISFRKDSTPLEREDEGEEGTKQGAAIRYGETGLYSIPAGSSGGYDIYNGTDYHRLPPSAATFLGGSLYLFNYSRSGIKFVESKQFTLAALEINEAQQ
jgi:hypothetical protein